MVHFISVNSWFATMTAALVPMYMIKIIYVSHGLNPAGGHNGWIPYIRQLNSRLCFVKRANVNGSNGMPYTADGSAQLVTLQCAQSPKTRSALMMLTRMAGFRAHFSLDDYCSSY